MMVPSSATKPPSNEDYEQMYRLLCAYNSGIISFLELLERYEEILHLSSHQTESVDCDSPG